MAHRQPNKLHLDHLHMCACIVSVHRRACVCVCPCVCVRLCVCARMYCDLKDVAGQTAKLWFPRGRLQYTWGSFAGNPKRPSKHLLLQQRFPVDIKRIPDGVDSVCVCVSGCMPVCMLLCTLYTCTLICFNRNTCTAMQDHAGR